jgi:D-psicose/D-tagatose/L-ribulose 3-epimerase
VKLCLSAIAWSDEEDEVALAVLKEASLQFIELVPGRVGAPQTKLQQLRELGITPHAFQALLYGTSGLSVFGPDNERTALLSHLETLSGLADQMGVKALVFGSPKNRWIDPERMTTDKAMNIAVEFFKEAGRAAAKHGTCLCLEPNPPVYGCNFLTSTHDVLDFLEKSGTEGLALNFDTGALIINGEDPATALARALPCIGHVHLSEPSLAQLGQKSSLPFHEAMARSLHDAAYSGVLSIEMARNKELPRREALETAIAFARSVYAAA